VNLSTEAVDNSVDRERVCESSAGITGGFCLLLTN